MGYTKLFSDIITSTIWQEPNDCRVLWITMLALKDKGHICRATVPALAKICNISNEECEVYLERFSEPDKYSRSQEHEGRRIERVEGGYLILNGDYYQELLSKEQRQEYKNQKGKEYRRQKKTKEDSRRQNVDTRRQNEDTYKIKTKTKTEEHVTNNLENVTIVESEHSTRQQTPVEEVFQFWQEQTKHPLAKLTPKRQRKIQARLTEGYSIAELQTAVRGCATSPFHQGDNDDGRIYDDIELICRDGEHVEQFINLISQGDTHGQTIRRNASRTETTSERRRRETAELCAALEADPLDSVKQIVSRPAGNGSH